LADLWECIPSFVLVLVDVVFSLCDGVHVYIGVTRAHERELVVVARVSQGSR
jgi:hypothetical protein